MRFNVSFTKPAGILLLFTLIVSSQQTTAQDTRYDRECLIGFVDRYLDAVVAHDPSGLPLSENLKMTENGQRLEPGDGLWNTMSGRGSYRLYVTDPQAGQVGYIGTIREGGVPAILGLRLKVDEDVISEIEMFVVRDDSETVKLEGLGDPHPRFLTDIPADERVSRDELVRVANMYFTGLERDDGKGVYPFTDDCDRVENGHFTTNHPKYPLDADGNPSRFDIDALGCKEQFELGFFAFVTRIRDRRFVVIDRERGLVFAFGIFDHAGNVRNVKLTNGVTFDPGVKSPFTWEIAEVFKIENGLISRIQALYQEAPYGMNSGWSTWEEGLSDRARTVEF